MNIVVWERGMEILNDALLDRERKWEYLSPSLSPPSPFFLLHYLRRLPGGRRIVGLAKWKEKA